MKIRNSCRLALLMCILNIPMTGFSSDNNQVVQTNSLYETIMQGYKLAKSVLLFHVSIAYNGLVYGTSFSFHQIAGDATDVEPVHGISIEFDEQGEIKAINDGKKTPLLLGSIPRHQRHIALCRDKFNLPKDCAIGIYTLNRPFECNWAGLNELVKDTVVIRQFTYPTTDFGAPIFIDLLRAVRDLEHRDDYNHGLAYVHCKAGRGRSAVTVAAYLAHVLQKAGIVLDAKKIKIYLQSKRSQVSLNAEHRAALDFFIAQLLNAGSFESLYLLHAKEIEKRDAECSC